MAEITRQRAGELLRGVLTLLSKRSEGMQTSEVLAQLIAVLPPTEFEAADYPNHPGTRRYENIVRFTTISPVKAGWITKSKGTWAITEAGIAALNQFPDPAALMTEARRLYLLWKEEQPQDDEDEPGIVGEEAPPPLIRRRPLPSRTTLEIIPDKRKVVGLVEQAYNGEICLPNFQRDFVWTREEVADLVRSIARGYFIGSLLLLRCDKDNPPFAPQFLRGARPFPREPQPEWLLLDGQQRMSSLIYALTAPDLSLKDSSQRRWFFVDLDILLGEPDNDEIVFDRASRELRGLDAQEVQYAVARSFRAQSCSASRPSIRGATGTTTGRVRTPPHSLSNIGRNGAKVGRLRSPTSRPLRRRSSSCHGSTTPTRNRSGACARSSKSSTRRASSFPSTTF